MNWLSRRKAIKDDVKTMPTVLREDIHAYFVALAEVREKSAREAASAYVRTGEPIQRAAALESEAAADAFRNAAELFE